MDDVRLKIKLRLEALLGEEMKRAATDPRLRMLRETREAHGISNQVIRDEYRDRIINAFPGCTVTFLLYLVQLVLPGSYPNSHIPIQGAVPRVLYRIYHMDTEVKE